MPANQQPPHQQLTRITEIMVVLNAWNTHTYISIRNNDY